MCAHSSYALPCNFDVPRNVVRWCVSVLWHMCLAYRAHCRKRACALGSGLRCKGFANCAHCARRGDDASGVGTNQSARHAQCPRRRRTQCVYSFFVERGSLDATLHACTDAAGSELLASSSYLCLCLSFGSPGSPGSRYLALLPRPLSHGAPALTSRTRSRARVGEPPYRSAAMIAHPKTSR